MAEQSYRYRALKNCEPNELRNNQKHLAKIMRQPFICRVQSCNLCCRLLATISTVENAIEIVVSLCHASQPTGFWTHLSPSLDSHASQPTALCTCRISLLASSRFIPTASRSLPSNAAKSSTHAAP